MLLLAVVLPCLGPQLLAAPPPLLLLLLLLLRLLLPPLTLLLQAARLLLPPLVLRLLVLTEVGPSSAHALWQVQLRRCPLPSGCHWSAADPY